MPFSKVHVLGTGGEEDPVIVDLRGEEGVNYFGNISLVWFMGAMSLLMFSLPYHTVLVH
jgi:hypothetical protein